MAQTGAAGGDEAFSPFAQVVEILEHFGQAFPAPAEPALQRGFLAAGSVEYPQLHAPEPLDVARPQRLEREFALGVRVVVSALGGRCAGTDTAGTDTAGTDTARTDPAGTDQAGI